MSTSSEQSQKHFCCFTRRKGFFIMRRWVLLTKQVKTEEVTKSVTRVGAIMTQSTAAGDFWSSESKIYFSYPRTEPQTVSSPFQALFLHSGKWNLVDAHTSFPSQSTDRWNSVAVHLCRSTSMMAEDAVSVFYRKNSQYAQIWHCRNLNQWQLHTH